MRRERKHGICEEGVRGRGKTVKKGSRRVGEEEGGGAEEEKQLKSGGRSERIKRVFAERDRERRGNSVYERKRQKISRGSVLVV